MCALFDQKKNQTTPFRGERVLEELAAVDHECRFKSEEVMTDGDVAQWVPKAVANLMTAMHNGSAQIFGPVAGFHHTRVFLDASLARAAGPLQIALTQQLAGMWEVMLLAPTTVGGLLARYDHRVNILALGPLDDHGDQAIYMEGMDAGAAKRIDVITRLQVTRCGMPRMLIAADGSISLQRSPASRDEVLESVRIYEELATLGK